MQRGRKPTKITGAKGRVFDLMKDEKWHDRYDICLAAARIGFATEGLRRMRELRQWFLIDKRALPEGHYEYRLRDPRRPKNRTRRYEMSL